jgi:hypothetical protein
MGIIIKILMALLQKMLTFRFMHNGLNCGNCTTGGWKINLEVAFIIISLRKIPRFLLDTFPERVFPMDFPPAIDF